MLAGIVVNIHMILRCILQLFAVEIQREEFLEAGIVPVKRNLAVGFDADVVRALVVVVAGAVIARLGEVEGVERNRLLCFDLLFDDPVAARGSAVAVDGERDRVRLDLQGGHVGIEACEVPFIALQLLFACAVLVSVGIAVAEQEQVFLRLTGNRTADACDQLCVRCAVNVHAHCRLENRAVGCALDGQRGMLVVLAVGIQAQIAGAGQRRAAFGGDGVCVPLIGGHLGIAGQADRAAVIVIKVEVRIAQVHIIVEARSSAAVLVFIIIGA